MVCEFDRWQTRLDSRYYWSYVYQGWRPRERAVLPGWSATLMISQKDTNGPNPEDRRQILLHQDTYLILLVPTCNYPVPNHLTSGWGCWLIIAYAARLSDKPDHPRQMRLVCTGTVPARWPYFIWESYMSMSSHRRTRSRWWLLIVSLLALIWWVRTHNNGLCYQHARERICICKSHGVKLQCFRW